MLLVHETTQEHIKQQSRGWLEIPGKRRNCASACVFGCDAVRNLIDTNHLHIASAYLIWRVWMTFFCPRKQLFWTGQPELFAWEEDWKPLTWNVFGPFNFDVQDSQDVVFWVALPPQERLPLKTEHYWTITHICVCLKNQPLTDIKMR